MTSRLLSAVLLFLLLAAAAAALLVGPADLFTLWQDQPSLARIVLFEIRLPRAALTLLTGFILGASGAALQGLLRNPLASPDVLGTSAGGALGAVLVGYAFGASGAIAMTIGGMVGAVLALALLVLIAGRGAGTATLILAGVAITAIAGALMNLLLALAPSPFALYDIIFWLLGSFEDRSLTHLAIGAPIIIVSALVLIVLAPRLDRLALGEEVAETIGVNVARLRLIIVLASGAGVGAAVAVAGSIGFIGLVVPHLVRPILADRPGAAVLPSGLAGAALLAAADLLTRIPIDGRTLPIGVITALIGAPVFLWLILQGRRA